MKRDPSTLCIPQEPLPAANPLFAHRLTCASSFASAYGGVDYGRIARPSVRQGRRPSIGPEPSESAMRNPTIIAALLAALAIAALLAFGIVFVGSAPSAAAYPADELSDQAAEPAEVGDPEATTPLSQWQQGILPHLYQDDAVWAQAPFGDRTIGTQGAAPTALCMAYAQQTGDASLTPADLASLGEAPAGAPLGTQAAEGYLVAAASELGLQAEPLPIEELALRQAIAHSWPVIAVLPGQGADPVARCVAIENIDEDSRLAAVDPASAAHAPEAWEFDVLLQEATALVAIHA